MKVLVTGGAGYIGSHFVKYLIENGHNVCILDSLIRGHIESVPAEASFEKVDLLDYEKIVESLQKYSPDAVVHFAAFAYVGESVENPEIYYQNNVVGSFNLIKACAFLSIKKFVFSSTCSIYGNPTKVPINEEEKSNPINPYANTKLIIEMILKDFDMAFGLKSICLRYFNAAGAHFLGEIGESHNPEPHLIPIVLFTAMGKKEKVLIFGNDYNTFDGTCIRDYIHVTDLADAHLKALIYLENNGNSDIINLGTGNGNSVLEIIQKAKIICRSDIPFEIVGRRSGDPAVLVADNYKAKKVLNWEPKYGIHEILETAWNWHKNQKY